MEELVKDICSGLESYLDKPYAFFGHSMGGWVAYELMLLLKQKGLMAPSAFFASGSRAPHLRYTGRGTRDLDDETFVKRLEKLSGTPPALLQNKGLIKLCLPMLRADFNIAEQYNSTVVSSLDTQLIVFAGESDTGVDTEDCQAWNKHFVTQGRLVMFAGGHFFVEPQGESIVKCINETISELSA
jgi:medium-chain acyl-[acyl-carrier-protein] hydrolase